MSDTVKLSNKLVGKYYPPYIISEACINHEGDINIAKEMIFIAKAMGSNCIKFQLHVLENEMLKNSPKSDNFEEPLWDTLEKTNFEIDEQVKLKKLCEEIGIDFLCTPFSRDAADLLDDINVDFFKIGSGEMTNHPLIEHVALKKKPMIISTGMSELNEIRETVNLVQSIGTPLILMHCISAYPCPYEIVNLDLITDYAKEFKIPIGLSDHSRGIYTSLGAVSLGASVIEKHITLDKLAKGPDHPSSIEPYELGELVKGCHANYQARGNVKKIYNQEREILEWARESVVSECNIQSGSIIEPHMVWVKRPSPSEGVIPAKDLKKVINRVANRDIPKDTQIKWEWVS